MTPEAVIADYIRQWEGGLSLDKTDTGNWINGKLIGSKYGVTGAALAAHRHVAPPAITAPMMAALTLDEAAAIGKAHYYDGTGLDKLAWNRVTASALDFGWGAGPGRACRKVQAMIGATPDGAIGPVTIRGYAAYLAQHGETATAERWQDIRNAYYERICVGNPAQRRFLQGWRNRSAYFAPGGKWWGRWA